MREFMAKMQMAFIATSDADGECDNSFRAGPPGFIRVLDAKTVCWPEYKGNGVMASMGNLVENPHVGILFVDFFETAVGLHVNGHATIVDNTAMEAFAPLLDRLDFATPAHVAPEAKKTPERWVVVTHRRGLHPLLQAHPVPEVGRRRRGAPARAPRRRRVQGQGRRARLADAGVRAAGRHRRGHARRGADAQPVGPAPAAARPQVAALNPAATAR